MMKNFLARAGVLAALAVSGVARGEVVEKIVAVVNEDILLKSELEQWTAQTARGPVDLDTPEGKKAWTEAQRKALDALIDTKLEQQQAAELKLSVTPEEIDRAIEAVREQNKLDE